MNDEKKPARVFDMHEVAKLTSGEREALRARLRSQVETAPCDQCGHTWAEHDRPAGCACGCGVRIFGDGPMRASIEQWHALMRQGSLQSFVTMANAHRTVSANTLRAIEGGAFFDTDGGDIERFCRAVVDAADRFLVAVKSKTEADHHG